MPNLKDGQTAEVQGSAKKPYVLKNVGGVYSCTCIAWRNQSLPIDKRTCKHLKAYIGEEIEAKRVGKTVDELKPVKEKTVKTTAPPVLLAHEWDGVQDLTGWWASEKFDGVRAWWDGENFWSREGNLYHAPDWFKKGLPKYALDGELWMGRKKFQETVGVVRRQDGGDLWQDIKYLIFDAPELDGTFEFRVSHLVKDTKLGKAKYALVAHHSRIANNKAFQAKLDREVLKGAEGLMVRQPQSMYEAGRSHTLLKAKKFFDAEARVTGYTSGKGKHKGRIGALTVTTEDGVAFSIGTGLTDKERESPPEVGTLVTYRYQELTKDGVPRFPSFVRIRSDKD